MFTSAKQYFNAVLTLGVFLLIAGGLELTLTFITEANKVQSEQLPLTVILSDTLTDGGIKTLLAQVRTQAFVLEVKFISKDDALKNYARQSGEKPMEVLDSNPLFNSLIVYTRHENQAEATINANALKQFPGVEDIYFTGSYFKMINSTDIWLRRVLWALIVLMAFLTIIVLTTTTRLLLWADRMRVRTALLVGARPGFIVGIFVKRALRYGVITGLVVAALLYGGLIAVLYSRPDWTMLNNREMTLYILGGVVATGILLPVLSTTVEIRRILSSRLEQMF